MKERPLVVVTDHLAEAGVEHPILADLADLILMGTTREEEILPRAEKASVLLVYHDIKIGARTIERLSSCLGIVRCGVGVDNVDLQAAGEQGIVVCNVPDYGTEEVADHALMLLLALTRRLVACDQAIRQGRWSVTDAFGAPRLRGQTLGILGCGRIGTAMALRAKALGLRVLAYDPYRPDGLDKALGIERTYDLEELFRESTFLSLHCPLTPETHHILNERTLALLPRGAYIINTARGPCIDLAALYSALETGHIAFAGLDVVEPEPLTHEGIRQHSRVLLTPHTAFYSVAAFEEMRSKGAQEGRRILLGQPVRNPVNLPFLKNPRAVVPPAMRLS